MKILLIHNGYKSDNVGGEDIVFYQEFIKLSELLGSNNVFRYQVSNDDISRFRLIFSIFFSFEHYRNVKSLVRKNNIDLVHVHNFFPLLTPSVFKAGRDAGAKVICTLHNYRLWCISGIFYREGSGVCELCTKKSFSLAGIKNKCYRNSFFQSLGAQLSFWFYRKLRFFDNIDYFFVLTRFQKKKVISLGISESKIFLKPNGTEECAIKLPNNSVKSNNYIYVGRLEEAKGIIDLLDCWTNLDEKFVLVVVGDSPIRSILEVRYDQKNIIFKGLKARNETLQLIERSKYLIQPSKLYETFGLTILEAMAVGVPVIGLDIGTRPEFIKNNINGFVCSLEELETTIRSSFNYTKYNFLSRNARSSALATNSETVITNQIKIYNKLNDIN